MESEVLPHFLSLSLSLLPGCSSPSVTYFSLTPTLTLGNGKLLLIGHPLCFIRPLVEAWIPSLHTHQKELRC